MTDINDFTDYTEGCHCGHSRGKHGALSCSGTRNELDTAGLPAPEYAPEDADSPFAWPANWPPVEKAPHVETPCECPRFSVADPEPPEEYR